MGVPKTADGRPRLAVEVFSNEDIPNPVAADGKPFVLPNSFPGEVLLNFTGSSDLLSPPTRFGGSLFSLEKAGIGDEEFEVDFLDGIFLAGGHIEWEGGSVGSTVKMTLHAPASTVTNPVPAGTGNCNLAPTGYGFNIIVPAAPGTGGKQVAVPVPIPSTDDESNAQTGYWNYSEPWVGNGTVSAGAPGASKYNLFDAPLKLAHFCTLHLLRDSGARDMIAPAIKPKWILPEWKMKITIHNADANKTLRLAWDLLVARRKST